MYLKGKRVGFFEDIFKDFEVEIDKKKVKKEKFDVFGNSVCGKIIEKGCFVVEFGKVVVFNIVKVYFYCVFKDDYD